MDVLINNAGVSQRSVAVDTAPEVYQQMLNIDLLATHLADSAATAADGHRGGRSHCRDQLSCGSNWRATANCLLRWQNTVYSAIWYALRCEVETLHNIRVTTVLPGSVATDGVTQTH